MFETIPSLVSTLGFPIAVCCYLLWERHHVSKSVQKEREDTMHHLENAIKNHLVTAINELKMEIVKLNERCNSGGKKT
ncbi:MAG: hypothetical protein IMF11_06020 [Proteobacteria bacterium]|nr:hypothetical protein [Pseudomonadota bacterium]